MTGAASPDTVSLPHGGDLFEASRLFANAPQPWVDLSTGINPDAYPVPPLPPEAFARLPSPEDLQRLEGTAAARYGVPQSMLLASAGTHPVLAALPRLFAPQDVAILGPTYAEHARAWRLGGHKVCEVADLGALRGEAIVVIVRPNNPTGGIAALEALAALHGQIAGRDGLLIIDEAFADLLPRQETALALPSLSHAIILRSFGKTYGLAGVRLAFAIAARTLMPKLRAELGPWPVSGPALHLGLAALQDADWLAQARARLTERSQWLETLFEQAGLRIHGRTPFFQLIDDPRAAALFHHLGHAGIFTRRFAGRPHWLRIGMPASEAETLARVEAAVLGFRG